MEGMFQSFEDGEMTVELLLHSLYSPDPDAITAEILKLSRLIDAAPLGATHDVLCAAFQTLMWARCPTGFSAPSESEWSRP